MITVTGRKRKQAITDHGRCDHKAVSKRRENEKDNQFNACGIYGILDTGRMLGLIIGRHTDECCRNSLGYDINGCCRGCGHDSTGRCYVSSGDSC